ncbi:MAG: M23 family metallopeptidase [Desulfuromonadales bacterium]
MKLPVIVVFLLLLLAGGAFFYLRDTSAPQIALRPGAGPVSPKRPLLLDLQDPGSGLAKVRVLVLQDGKEQELLSKTYENGTVSREERLFLERADLQDGAIEVRVSATDNSIFPFGRGNRAEQTFAFSHDSKPPTISPLSKANNINQGGAGLIVYTVSEEPAKSGIVVGDLFFPGFRLQEDAYACLFPFPWDMSPDQFKPRLIAVDHAGNERLTGFNHHLNARKFPRDRINVSQGFLDAKMPEFEHAYPAAGDLLELFLQVNGEMREQNVQALLDIGRQTASEPLWQGAFVRQPGAARGMFAQSRTYLHQGKEIDRATHLGIDIAGLAQMPIVAANRGTVVFADYHGIYGNCVVIDHGLGLQSLYAHLSTMTAQVGETVEKEQEIGRSGATGMAGGDHLHFGVLVHGIEVMPLEWWDAKWLRNNISGKLEALPTAAN